MEVYAPANRWNFNTGCLVTGKFYVQPTNGTLPSYDSLAPLLVAAYIFAKPVSLNLVACTAWDVPVIGGIQLNP